MPRTELRIVDIAPPQEPGGLWAVRKCGWALYFCDTKQEAEEVAESLVDDLRFEEERER